MMHIPLNEVIHFDAITSDPSTMAAIDADSAPTFKVFEEATDTDIGVGGNMTKRTSETGNYRGSFTVSAANGFEVGKWYSIVGSATVGGVSGKGVLKNFRVGLAEISAGVPDLTGTTVGALSATERTAIANEVEAQIINDADAEQVLTAITNKIATAFADLDDLSLSAIASAVWTRVLTEGYRATGAQGTAQQLMYEILQNLTKFEITATTKTVKKLDGTTAKTYTLNDATNPTGITEAT